MSPESRLKTFFTLPNAQANPAIARKAQVLYVLLIITTSGSLASAVLQWLFAPPNNKAFNVISNGVEALIGLGLIIWLRRGGFRPVSILTVLAAFAGSTLPIIAYADIRVGPAVFAYVVVLGLAVLLLTPWEVAIVSALAGLTLYGIQYGVEQNLFQPQLAIPDAFSAWISYLTILILGGGAMALASYNLQQSIVQEHQKAKSLAESQKALEALNARLQEEVENRTEALKQQAADLQARQARLEHRNRQLELLASISRIITSEKNIHRLMQRSANALHHELGYYHVGIFLLDERREFAVLQAVNTASEGGKRMLARHHRLTVGQVGIVGTVAASGTPRIALDTGSDRVYFNNPDLPETRSEMALPLTAEGKIIGVLDIQSKEAAAFHDEDMETFNILAEQIAQGIYALQRLEESQKLAKEAARIYTEEMKTGWAALSQRHLIGLARQRGQKIALEKVQSYPSNIVERLRRGETCALPEQNQVVVPIMLRGDLLGTLSVNSKQISRDIIFILEQISRRLALAVENARLLDEAQERARREKEISALSTQINTSVSVDSILRTVVEEIGDMIPGAEVTLQFLADKEGEHA